MQSCREKDQEQINRAVRQSRKPYGMTIGELAGLLNRGTRYVHSLLSEMDGMQLTDETRVANRLVTAKAIGKCEACGNLRPETLTKCPRCGAKKCELCDMGDDVECPACCRDDRART